MRTASRPGAGGSRKLSNTGDRKSTRLNSSHMSISYAVFCLKEKRPYTVQPLGNAVLYQYTGRSMTDTVSAVGTVEAGFNAFTILLYPRYFTYGNFTEVLSKMIQHAIANGGTFTGFFFFNVTATTEIYTLSLHDALPI